MYQLNSYLKKASLLVFAVLMFAVIPNLQVYSSIGSYQIGSTAITANKRYTPSSMKIGELSHRIFSFIFVKIFKHSSATV